MSVLHSQTSSATIVTWREWMLAALTGLGLALFVWRTLALGGGLVGGDTYPYFFPQKQVLAEALQNGELPLWHDRTGHGYPLHAESQAGVFYPANQLLYRLLDINTAYSTGVILHYWLSFVLTWRFVRTQRVSAGSALMAAMVFAYGWFPARVSLEWSIIGGVWLPACLWMTDRFVDRPSSRRFCALALCFALHLLAGHFALAFISQLTCCGYAALRFWQQYRMGETNVRTATRSSVLITAAIAAGMLLASVQLAPTLELKRLSQREGINTAFDPGYGHLPPIYLTQLFASWWLWHTPEAVTARELTMYPFLSISSATNQVEAHLYFGLIPLAFCLLSFCRGLLRKGERTVWLRWLILSLAAVIYATGWLIPVTRHLPGFGFFMGPGRYTIITSLGAAIVSALVLDALLRSRGKWTRLAVLIVVCLVTLPDLLTSSRYPVRDAVEVTDPPLNRLSSSWIARHFEEYGSGNVRLLAPGPNVGNLYGVSCVPQYLGLGPAEYYVDEKTYRTQPDAGDEGPFPSDTEMRRLRERGVTHLLSTEKIANPSSQIQLVHAAPDEFLNAVWGRGSASCWLYHFVDPPQRVFVADTDQAIAWSWINRSPANVTFQISLDRDGDVSLRELMIPGWEVSIDGESATPLTESGFVRAVRVAAGEHTVRWTYRPFSFRLGCILSAITGLILLFIAWRGVPDNRTKSGSPSGVSPSGA